MGTNNNLPESKRMRIARKNKEEKSSPEELERKNKAAIYLRISSEMQKDNFSIAAQKEECMKYVLEKGFTVAEENIYIDEAYSAKDDDRPAFQKMLADAHAGQFSLIVAHKLDRLLRNLKLHLGIVEDLKKINVTLYSEIGRAHV